MTIAELTKERLRRAAAKIETDPQMTQMNADRDKENQAVNLRKSAPSADKNALEVHSVGGDVLMACPAPAISRDEVEALAQGIVAWHKELAPADATTYVFRDSAFADDVAKTNPAAILQQSGIDNVRSL